MSVAIQRAKVQRCEGHVANCRVRLKSTVQKSRGPFRALVVSSRWPRGAPGSWGPWRRPPGATAEREIHPRFRRRLGALWGGWGWWAGRERAQSWKQSGGSDWALNRSGFHPGDPPESGGDSQDMVFEVGGWGGPKKTKNEGPLPSWRRSVGKI